MAVERPTGEANPFAGLAADRLETILEDGEFVLCRGVDPGGPTVPARSVLVVMPRSEHPRPQAVRMLEHEHALREELDSAWAARSLALTTREGRVALVVEDPGGDLLASRAGTAMDIGRVVRVGAGLATALRHLHSRGLIHKDIKPTHVMTDWSTGRVWLRGFGITARAPRERRLPEPPAFIAGTLAYMAPEQTGWMNRSIDARSDLYAFGVVLYELLTGSLPFTASDPMGWVHCHMAKRPVPPVERVIDLPQVVSAIVMKLLAKTAEDRYQTAAGVERDLRRCLAQWEADGRIDEFAPAEQDTPDRLLIPETLYGRTREVETLLEAFDRVMTNGTPELVLVSGYAGIGKSSVVNELHKVLVPPRGLFASGKFDQYRRDIPYATLAQAFDSLIRRLLGKSEMELAPWREALREALCPNARLIVDLVPALTHLIGEAPPVPDLPPQDARRRFQLVFRKFIGVFARAEHPLALFLDDLQWLDTATLDLVEDLLNESGLHHVLLIGAYRDNEVTPDHPLMRRLGAMRNAGAKVEEITLGPLPAEDVQQMAADALRSALEHAAPLGRLVHEKTGGNPFFVIQFLASLAEEGLLAFDHDRARWCWDLGRIQAKGYTDNVVDLMVARLTRLPADTQQALQPLACLGHTAETPMLAIVLGTSEEEVHAKLWPAVRQELVERQAGTYRFVHDRIQESAYTLIPKGQRAAQHLQVGRLLVAHTPPEGIAEHVFEIVSQFNHSAALITSSEERERVAQLNLIAGQRARASTAYASALAYLAAGAALLPADEWERRPALAFALNLQRAECEFLTGDMAAADHRLKSLSSHATTLEDLAAVTCLREDLLTTVGRSDAAVAACLEFLQHIRVRWSAHPTDAEVEQEYERLRARVGTRPIEEFVNLPLMSDAVCCATMKVLSVVFAAAHFTDENLLCLVSLRMTNLSLEYGNSDLSCVGYAYTGVVLGRFGQYRDGFSFGRLGVDLVERRGLRGFEARVYSVFGHLVAPWTQPLNAARRLVEHSFDVAIRTGDLTFATFDRQELFMTSYFEGDHLGDVEREAEAGLEFARKIKFPLIIDLMTADVQFIRSLRGLTPEFGSLDDTDFDERQFERHLAGDPRLAIIACQYWIHKLTARVFTGAYLAAGEAASNARPLLWTQSNLFYRVRYHHFAALASAGLWDMASAAERCRHREAVMAHQRQFQEWTESGVANVGDSAALVEAELARIDGRDIDAMRLYESAIAFAKASGFVHNEALASELAARFYTSRGFEEIARLYLGNARRGYARWGADGKVRHLDARYPYLSDDPPASDARATIGAPVEELELATVLKVSQAVSSEIVLEKLVETVLRTAIEHAGAERGALIVPRENDLWVQAEASTDGGAIPIIFRDSLIGGADLPESVVRYAARARESVRLDDAAARGGFSSDTYIRRKQARSVLCLPLLQQGQFIALLYLENNVAGGVFTPARMAVLNVLASQAAMSLEKTRLYRELQQREAKIRRLVDANIIGIMTYDLDGRITDANEAFLRIVGYDREDLVAGRLRWTDLTPPDWREQDERLLPRLKLLGRVEPFEKEYFHKDGRRVPVLLGAASFDDNTNAGLAYVLDLTERKRAEDGRRRAEAQLQQARTALAHRQRVTMMGEVAASLAHEIKQPIVAARIDAKVCVNALTDDHLNLQAAREAASRMAKEAAWAAEIVGRTTALFKKETHRERVNVTAVIREMTLLLQQEASASSIGIRTELAEGIPNIMADRVQLQQVFMNLMLNAIDAMKDSGGELTISAQPGQDGELLIAVRDTGVGLPSENPDQIFESFVTTKAHGTGMGLAITRSIVEAHGGRLWAIANAGPGATFLFTLINEAGK
jgi:PAS domain S-box-containing protein